jgi:hypothetical protein
VRITELEILNFKDALEDGDCGNCGERLSWSFNNNSENPEHTAKCCGYTYRIIPYTVEIFREPGSD